MSGSYQAQFEEQLEESLDAEARREASDMPVGQRLDADDLSEGDVVVFREVDGADEFRAEVQDIEHDVDGNVDTLRVQGTQGPRSVFPTEDGLVTQNVAYEAFDTDRRGIPDVGIDTASYDEVRGALDEWVERGGTSHLSWSGEDEHPISDAAADEAFDEIAESLSSAKHEGIAERTVGTLTHVGDDVESTVVGNQEVLGVADTESLPSEVPRSGMLLREDSSLSAGLFSSRVPGGTPTHEAGHTVLYAYNYGPTNADASDAVSSVPSYNWGARGSMDPRERRTLQASTETATSVGTNAYKRSNWEPKVDRQIAAAAGPDTAGFQDPPSVGSQRSEWWTQTVEEGGLIQFEQPVSAYSNSDGAQVWQVEDKSSGYLGGSEYQLSNRQGDVMRVTVDDGGGLLGGTGEITDSTADGGVPSVSGYSGDSGDWRIATPDPDEVLGSSSPSSDEAAMARVAEQANEAWYRQAALKREYSGSAAVDATLGRTYSAGDAHETFAITHEIMQRPEAAASGSDGTSVDTSQAADALVNYHPELLDAYHSAFDIDPTMKQELNDALEQAGASFRFDI